jgi:hypothetical protein
MRPRVYDAYAEQKIDQRIGFIAFPIVNIVVWLVTGMLLARTTGAGIEQASNVATLRTAASWLPWVVNGLVLIWAAIFRWHIGVGYLVSCGGFLVTGVGLGLIGVVVSFVSVPLLALTGLLGLLVFLLLILVASIWFLLKMFGLLRRWWAI